jgi:hypothetical protein
LLLSYSAIVRFSIFRSVRSSILRCQVAGRL